MSSVTRFLRQIPTGQSHYQVIGDSQITTGIYYRFNPEVGNYVGNYPPGEMEDITATVKTAAAANVSNGNISQFVLRDMGKTFRALDTNGDEAFFRQMQLVFPSGTVSTTLTSLYATFGVAGGVSSPAANAPYFTVYLPIPVDGRGFLLPAGVACVAIASGQM